jgi:hypothetical protein
MNIFFLSSNPTVAAKMQCDKHVVKMILETAQMLSTAHRVLDGDEYADMQGLYKRTHENHPSAVWVRSSVYAYTWTYLHMLGLLKEYTNRYGKVHATQRLQRALRKVPDNLSCAEWSAPPQCVDDKYKQESTVQAYRDYYVGEKAYMAQWNHSNTPNWYKEAIKNK